MNSEYTGAFLKTLERLVEAVDGVGEQLEEIKRGQVTAQQYLAGQAMAVLLPNATCSKAELARVAHEVAVEVEKWGHVDFEDMAKMERERNLLVQQTRQRAEEKARAFREASEKEGENLDVGRPAESWEEIDGKGAAMDLVAEPVRPGTENVGKTAYGVSPIEEQPVWDRGDDHK